MSINDAHVDTPRHVTRDPLIPRDTYVTRDSRNATRDTRDATRDARDVTLGSSDVIVISDAETVVTGDDDSDTRPATPPIFTIQARTQLCRGKHCRFKRYTMYQMVLQSRATQTE